MALKGGDKMRTRLEEISKSLSKGTLNVGFLEDGSTEPNGTLTAQVAYYQEFGAPRAGIPPRPFFRPMIAAKSPEWGPALAQMLEQNGYDAQGALDALGQIVAGELSESIRNVNSPALSPVTLLLRQRFGNNPQEITGADVRRARDDIARGVVPSVTATQAKPLIWTGEMYRAVRYEVEE